MFQLFWTLAVEVRVKHVSRVNVAYCVDDIIEKTKIALATGLVVLIDLMQHGVN